jgi:hypothetical protein
MNPYYDAMAQSGRRLESESRPLVRKHALAAVLSILFCVMYPANSTAAIQDDDTTRGLWDTAFLQKRPAGTSATARNRQVKYRSLGSRKLVPSRYASAKEAVVGLTVWRLRPASATDEVRQLVRNETGEWTPERISSNSPLQEGQYIQITIEAPRSGYLYVFDREMYADKSLGEPYMIFPTSDINGGDNKVMAGRVIEIPSSEDKPPYYTLKASRPDYRGELLTVLITDTPLAELPIGPGAVKLPSEQVASFEKKWGAIVDNLELVGGAGTAMTKTEKTAAEGKQLLTQADSLPQTIFRIRSKPGTPLILSVPLRIGKGST